MFHRLVLIPFAADSVDSSCGTWQCSSCGDCQQFCCTDTSNLPGDPVSQGAPLVEIIKIPTTQTIPALQNAPAVQNVQRERNLHWNMATDLLDRRNFQSHQPVAPHMQQQPPGGKVQTIQRYCGQNGAPRKTQFCTQYGAGGSVD